MTASVISRPQADEYATYYGNYISKVPEGDLLAMLATQVGDTLTLIRGIPEARGDYRYAPDKWSIKEVVGHICDTERIMGYRALRIARADATPLPGFEQNDYVPAGDFNRRTLGDLGEELAAVRQATLHLFRHLGPEALTRRGSASGNPFTPRALAYVIAGHERHHVGILKAKYLGS